MHLLFYKLTFILLIIILINFNLLIKQNELFYGFGVGPAFDWASGFKFFVIYG